MYGSGKPKLDIPEKVQPRNYFGGPGLEGKKKPQNWTNQNRKKFRKGANLKKVQTRKTRLNPIFPFFFFAIFHAVFTSLPSFLRLLRLPSSLLPLDWAVACWLLVKMTVFELDVSPQTRAEITQQFSLRYPILPITIDHSDLVSGVRYPPSL